MPRYALFRMGKQETKSYEAANQVMLFVAMLMPQALHYVDGKRVLKAAYEIKALQEAVILPFKREIPVVSNALEQNECYGDK